jgi:hypothetical protein
MVSSELLRRVALVRTTRRNNPEDIILHSHRRENLKSYQHLNHVKFQVFTVVIMKNAVFWDINTQFVPRKKHITSPLQSPAG